MPRLATQIGLACPSNPNKTVVELWWNRSASFTFSLSRTAPPSRTICGDVMLSAFFCECKVPWFPWQAAISERFTSEVRKSRGLYFPGSQILRHGISFESCHPWMMSQHFCSSILSLNWLQVKVMVSPFLWLYKVVPPSYVCWFISPITIDISPINQFVKLELCAPTERSRTGAPPHVDQVSSQHLGSLGILSSETFMPLRKLRNIFDPFPDFDPSFWWVCATLVW